MKIIDKYILKKYFSTFLGLMLLFIPISIVFDLSERIDKIFENNIPFNEVASYYRDFILYFFNLLFPIFLFLSIIWFTSRLAQNTEIIAMLNTGMPFLRFLRPYLIGATVIATTVLFLNFSIIPKARIGYHDFWKKYVYKHEKIRETNDIYRKIDSIHYIYASNMNHKNKTAYNFVFEEIRGNKMKYRIYADRIVWKPKEKKYRLFNMKKRIYLADDKEKILNKHTYDTIFPFTLEDLTPIIYAAEGLNYFDLNKFIEKEKIRGSKNINYFLLEKYKRISLPISAFILTFIAVAVASRKKRGGIGYSLLFGIVISLLYVFFDKIFGILSVKSGFSPFLAAWIPNIVFGIIAVILVKKAAK